MQHTTAKNYASVEGKPAAMDRGGDALFEGLKLSTEMESDPFNQSYRDLFPEDIRNAFVLLMVVKHCPKPPKR